MPGIYCMTPQETQQRKSITPKNDLVSNQSDRTESKATQGVSSKLRNTDNGSQSYFEIDPSKLIIKSEYQQMVAKIDDSVYETLKESIRRNGQLKPVTCNKALVVLDGHHRYRACKELGMAVKYESREFPNDIEEKRFIINANIPTRRPNDYQLWEMVMPLVELESEAAKIRRTRKPGRDSDQLAHFGANKPSHTGGKTSDKIASWTGLSTRQVERILSIMQKGNPELNAEARSGQKTVG